MTISLTGFMGCGKSSVGRELSALLSCSYADLLALCDATGMQGLVILFLKYSLPLEKRFSVRWNWRF